jgi:hypothetical protein
MAAVNCKRKDLISYEKIYNLKDNLKLKQQDICSLLQVDNSTRFRYEKEGLVPLLRFQSIINALKIQAQEEYQARIKLIDDILNDDI